MMSVLEGRLFIDSPQPGARNMAIDDALLIDAAENGIATFRIYGWTEPTLSLGYFQRYEDRWNHPASCNCAIVRRQTGGGAILHDHELTYSLTLPATHPLAQQNSRLYAIVHQSFIDILSPMIASGTVPWKLTRREAYDAQSSKDEPFLCFQRRAFGDVVLVTAGGQSGDPGSSSIASKLCGSKILGSAQRRFHGAVLQHGSLLLQRSPLAPELAGLCDLVQLTVEADRLAALIVNRLENTLSLKLSESVWPPKLQSKADEFTNIKYGSANWTKRR